MAEKNVVDQSVTSTDATPPVQGANEDNRFYKNICSSYPNEPTKDKFKIVEIREKGEGLIALKPFSRGEIVFSFNGKIVEEQTLMTLQVGPGKYILDDKVMGKVLHSCDPNMDCDINSFTFTARKDIPTNEVLTMDYESTEDELFQSFICGCKSKNCRGYITGRKKQNISVAKKQETYHMICFYVPENQLEQVKMAIYSKGAGIIGNYENVCWQILGEEQFVPLPGSNPFLGGSGILRGITKRVKSYKVEIVCPDSVLDQVIKALGEAHPYENPVYYSWKIEFATAPKAPHAQPS